jgi:hypothetical protein
VRGAALAQGRALGFALKLASAAVGWLLVLSLLLLLAGLAAGWWRFSNAWFPMLFASVFAALAAGAWARWRRERIIREAPLPQWLKRKLREHYPQLDQKQADLVERGLRQFFLACHRSSGKFVAMPSRAVDAMWHEFILHTQAYREWCALALGRFLHHTPAEALGTRAAHNDGLRRAWYWTCKDEAIDPRQPSRLPLLFALDGKLGIANGFHYVPDCRQIDRAGAGGAHCGTSFSDGSASGDADGFGGAASADGGGDGGCGGGGD